MQTATVATVVMLIVGWTDAAAAPHPVSDPVRRVIAGYFETLARPDNGYGWSDQPDSHLTPTFAAIGCHRLLGQTPPRVQALAGYIRTHHPTRGRNAEAHWQAARQRNFTVQQIQSLVWLGEDARSFDEEVIHWAKPASYAYERNRNPVFQQEMMAFIGRRLSGLSVADLSPVLVDYLHSRRRANGSFNNTPADDGSDGHVMNTWWGVQALQTLGAVEEMRAEAIVWLQACQLHVGGFTYQPNAAVGGVDDVAYTWAAVRSLAALGGSPRDRAGCVRYLRSLWNSDGGFGDRPGLPSRPMSTYYALDALAAIDALSDLGVPLIPRPPEPPELPAGLRPFTIQIEAPGQGSPAEAVELARALRIHLWGAKNADPAWILQAQKIADQRNVPVRFFVSNEEYGTYVRLPGLGSYNHISDPVAPAGVDIGPRTMTGNEASWPDFRDRRIGALETAGGRMVWQLSENEEFARILIDDSIESRGYAAISTFHFWCKNFAYTFPYIFRYRHLLPFVALQDAHGSEAWWWSDNLTGYRTVFLAEDASWAAFLQALENRWVVAIRHDAVTRFRTRLMGGAPGVQERVREHESDWKWWGERPDDIRRPEVSVVAISPDDEFEVARPSRGIVVRVRCWRRNSPQGTPTDPMTELVSLSINGKPATPQLVEQKNDNGVVIDSYHQVVLANLDGGDHTASATVRRLDTGARLTREIRFMTPNRVPLAR